MTPYLPTDQFLEPPTDTLAMSDSSSMPSTGRDSSAADEASAELLWRAVLKRAPEWDGVFFYAVKTTGVFCRSTCPSRRPRRENVEFFTEAHAARDAGFRPCKRCRPEELRSMSPDRQAVLEGCRRIDEHPDHNPTLTELGQHVGMSPGHFRKLFEKVLGVSPKNYADAVRLHVFRRAVGEGLDVTGALYEAGYGSSSRLYEKAGRALGMTPAAYRRRGEGLTVRYRITPSALGLLLVAATERGLCAVELADSREELLWSLQLELGQADLVEDDGDLEGWTQALTEYLSGTAALPELPLDIRVTAFQARVYRALRKIPEGRRMTYSEVAEAIGQPTATRAVARACARNPVALTVPCHRVVPKRGGVGGYRWGEERKQALLEIEGGRRGRHGV